MPKMKERKINKRETQQTSPTINAIFNRKKMMEVYEADKIDERMESDHETVMKIAIKRPL
jgi:hypothetical protein